MADAVTAGAAPLLPSLPDELVVWEILTRLHPKSLLRCRAVSRAWRRTTSTRDFLLAHHGRQPSLPVVYGYEKSGELHQGILAFDHRAADAQLQPVARLDNKKFFRLEACCDGLLILSEVKYKSESRLVIVFDTTTELFKQMRAPVLPTKSYVFEMDGTLGIYRYDDPRKVVDIWVLQNYQGEVWEHKYRVELPVAEIRGQCGMREGHWYVRVVSADGDVLLLLCHDQWLFYADIDGKLVDSFHLDGQPLCTSRFRLKQTLVPHTFFTTLEDCALNASPFI
ncbi:unnamed protein product [Alopecurus aequalis]